jgi:hypothetical protein
MTRSIVLWFVVVARQNSVWMQNGLDLLSWVAIVVGDLRGEGELG